MLVSVRVDSKTARLTISGSHSPLLTTADSTNVDSRIDRVFTGSYSFAFYFYLALKTPRIVGPTVASTPRNTRMHLCYVRLWRGEHRLTFAIGVRVCTQYKAVYQIYLPRFIAQW